MAEENADQDKGCSAEDREHQIGKLSAELAMRIGSMSSIREDGPEIRATLPEVLNKLTELVEVALSYPDEKVLGALESHLDAMRKHTIEGPCEKVIENYRLAKAELRRLKPDIQVQED